MTRPRLTVLFSTGTDATDTDNPFIALLVGALTAEDVDIVPFSWKSALFGKYDLMHCHWPEVLVRDRLAVKRLVKMVLVGILLIRLKLQSKPLVQTLHNLSPHEAGDPIEQMGLRLLSRRVALNICLRQDAGYSYPTPMVVIPHGHYRVAGAVARSRRAATTDVLAFGNLRPYKGLEELIQAASYLEGRATVKILGAAQDESYLKRLVMLAAEVPNVQLDNRSVPSCELESEIASARLVALPYRNFYNSGAALLALSIGAPILVPNTPSTNELKSEVGAQWVRVYDPPLSAAGLLEALTWADSTTKGNALPKFIGREWPDIAAKHRDVYQSLIKRTKRTTGVWERS